jgi:hypothetical protein
MVMNFQPPEGAQPVAAVMSEEDQNLGDLEEEHSFFAAYLLTLQKYNRTVSLFYSKSNYMPRALKAANYNLQMTVMMMYTATNVDMSYGDIEVGTCLFSTFLFNRFIQLMTGCGSQRDGHMSGCKNSCSTVCLLLWTLIFHISIIGFCYAADFPKYDKFHSCMIIIVFVEYLLYDFFIMPFIVLMVSKCSPRAEKRLDVLYPVSDKAKNRGGEEE